MRFYSLILSNFSTSAASETTISEDIQFLTCMQYVCMYVHQFPFADSLQHFLLIKQASPAAAHNSSHSSEIMWIHWFVTKKRNRWLLHRMRKDRDCVESLLTGVLSQLPVFILRGKSKVWKTMVDFTDSKPGDPAILCIIFCCIFACCPVSHLSFTPPAVSCCAASHQPGEPYENVLRPSGRPRAWETKPDQLIGLSQQLPLFWPLAWTFTAVSQLSP